VGNEGLCVVGVSGSWDKRSFLLLCATSLLSLPSLEFPCPVEFSPISGVTYCLSDEQRGLRLGGSWKVCTQLVDYSS
jgi:hypothetical protein